VCRCLILRVSRASRLNSGYGWMMGMSPIQYLQRIYAKRDKSRWNVREQMVVGNEGVLNPISSPGTANID